MILEDLVDALKRSYGDKVVELDEEWRYPYSVNEVMARVLNLGNALYSVGMVKGDRVAVLSRNCPQYREIYLACILHGLVPVPLNYRLSKAELEFIVSDCTPSTLIVQPDYAEIADSIRSRFDFIKNVIWLDNDRGPGLNYDELVNNNAGSQIKVSVDEEDLALIQYTSATTGKPKGASLTQRNIYAGIRNKMSAMASCNAGTIYLGTWPLHGSAGFFNDMSHFFAGANIIICERFDTSAILKNIPKYHITSIHMIPTMLKFLFDDPEFQKVDLRSLQVVNYGSGSMSEKLLGDLMNSIPQASFEQLYGSTETVEVCLLNKDDHRQKSAEGHGRITSVGRSFPGVLVRIVDDEDRDVPTGQTGEIIAKSESVMKGYWNLPLVNSEVLRDGWFHMGDLGSMDSEGYIYLLGRKDDMIKSGGYNIYPREIEDVISSHPAVSEVAVIGIPDPEWVMSVKAFIVLKPGKTVSETELIGLCKAKLASFKKPKKIEFVPSLPKNAMGKILKRELKKLSEVEPDNERNLTR